MSDIQFDCPHCSNTLLVDSGGAGLQVQCPECQKSIVIPHPKPASPPKVFHFPPEALKPPPPPKPSSYIHNSASGSKEYKVLTQKDKWFSGKFDPEMLEDAINSYAVQGWQVISVATATFPGGFGGNREELVVVMGRDK